MDAIAIFMLVHADWYVTATAYAMSAQALESIYRRRGSVVRVGWTTGALAGLAAWSP